MNERLTLLSFKGVNPLDAGALSANFLYTTLPFQITIVAVSVAPSVDDAGATIDINDDGTGVITAIDASDQNVPGTWKSKHIGGTNAPVTIAAGSLLSFDANSAAAATAFDIQIWALIGEVSA